MKKYLLFDLDGTLTDPMEGITNSVAYALEFYGIHVEDRNTLTPFIGPPLKDSFMKYYGFPPEQAEEAIWKYREYFEKSGMFENAVIPGIPEALARLKDAGKVLITATSKPEIYAKKIMEKFGLSPYFTDICGADMEETRVRKADVIVYAMEKNGITDLAETIMVGDREHDILGAKECGLKSVGVLFGYGSREELAQAGADFIAETVEEMAEILRNPNA
ncbi:MAG: HAD family hydrolase [Eubacteriales bacterium]|nr:HAD family hydrolase [Eubacteriales bacterium]